MTAAEPVTAALLIIGDEILSGRTRDANLPHLARELNERGIRLAEARVISDDEDAIIEAVNALRARCSYVFTTGGIGPTHDDITAQSIAKAFGVPLVRDAEAVRRLQSHYEPGQLNAARLRMADVPEGAELVDNPVSQAPGFRMENVYVLAGVPTIMRAMLDGVLLQLVGGRPLLSRTVTCTLGEGLLAEGLGVIQDRHPDVSIGSYPYFRAGKFGVSLVLRADDAWLLGAATEDVAVLIRSHGDEPQITEGEAPAGDDAGADRT